jgi:large subunit ribosomal protein L10
MKRETKEQMVAELREELAKAPSIIVASSVGMPVNTVNELRSALRAQGSRYRIIKNTLAKIAIAGTDLEPLGAHLTGPTALAYNLEDAVAPAKAIVDFKKDNDKLEIKAGYLNGSVLDASGVEALSKMPGKDELRAKLLSVMNGVGTKFVRTLAAAPQQMLTVLVARKDSIG